MKPSISEARRRALCLYYSGQWLVIAGFAATSALHSFLPLSLAGSAAIMMSWPIVRDLLAPRRR